MKRSWVPFHRGPVKAIACELQASTQDNSIANFVNDHRQEKPGGGGRIYEQDSSATTMADNERSHLLQKKGLVKQTTAVKTISFEDHVTTTPLTVAKGKTVTATAIIGLQGGNLACEDCEVGPSEQRRDVINQRMLRVRAGEPGGPPLRECPLVNGLECQVSRT